MRKTLYFQLLFVILLLVILYKAKMLVIASFIGIGFGVLVSPVLDIFQKWFRLRRSFCALIFILSIFICMGIIGSLAGWLIFDQINQLIGDLPQLSEKLRAQIESIFDRFPWVLEHIKDIDFAGFFQAMSQYLFGGIQLGFVVVGGAIFALFIGIYLAIASDFYLRGTIRAFPPKYRERAEDLLVKCARVVRAWFRAQLLDMAIIGAITAIGLLIAGVNFWAVFGLLTAIFGIIPYVGIIFVVIIVSMVTLASDPFQIPWVLLVFLITQQIEGNLVLPWVMKGQVEIPEAILLIVMLFFGFWFGLLGVFIAPPFLAVFICLYRNLYLPAIETNRCRSNNTST